MKLVVNNDKTDTQFNSVAHAIADILNASDADPFECLLILGAVITEVMHENFPKSSHSILTRLFDETLREILEASPITTEKEKPCPLS